MSVASAATSTKREIQSNLRRWRGDLPEEHVPLFRDFVQDTLSRLRGPFLAHHPAKQVLQYLEAAFAFALSRPARSVKVELRPAPAKGIVAISCMDDQPFIVDTIRLFLRSRGADYWGGFNLTFDAHRDADGNLIAVGEGGERESLVLLEADGSPLAGRLDDAAETLRTNLTLARAIVEDFRPMTRAVDRYVEKLEVAADRQPDQADALRETAAFLKWLLAENFVFMGVDSGASLGIQRLDTEYRGRPDGDWPPPHLPGTVRVRKSLTESPVHRAGRIDELLVSMPGEDDVDQALFIRGMFTYRAVTQPCRHVPILRRVLGSILAQQQSRPGSFRYKGMANVYDSLPTEFLFTASEQAIAETLDLVFESEQQQEVGVTFLMTGPYSAFCLVAMPKSQFSDELRRDLEDHIVGTLHATYSDHGIFVGRYDTVLLHYYLTGVQFPGESGLQALTEHIRGLATPWTARLWQGLSNVYDESTADRLTDTYGRAFPEPWTRSTSARRAVRDVQMLESLSVKRRLVADAYEDDGHFTLRLYQASDIYLTDILPVLDNFGLIVIESNATRVDSRGGLLHIDTFRLQGAQGIRLQEMRTRAPLLVDAIEAVFAGDVESDPLNQLVVDAGLSWDEVDILRAYVRYARQLQLKLSAARVQEILLLYPKLCIQLVQLFHARFDPKVDADERGKLVEQRAAEVVESLRHIRAHDEDLTFSMLLQLVQGTLRTNAYRADRKLHYLSFKFDCAQIPVMGPRRPTYEIYVHQKDVEGVHIRFGKVARGGLRWSDRDDYRTEIMGLATTQVVKNVVIVPVGSKGGFHLKNASRDPAARRQEADRCYRTFIRGLLDLTDNAVNGELTRPPGVVCHDPPDPYLVVAADKGTAHLSDTANKLSEEYGFWLGDAFASGGSNGYDHKKVGITARGAWVLVRRHFAEMGIDPYTETFTVAGVGDMGGDVFGNGLLETPKARLLAAFNHLHVFLDPDPDPATSYAERKRLFEAGRAGGWDAYDPSLISEGGGVFDRSAKSIPLSPQVQKMLDLPLAEATPEQVIHHILRMEVDLLWNGGIGTYVKASTESHAAADDRANDTVRVDGCELRARILGEGGNLGMTQLGRIEAAQQGVRLNADFIDNSGGVDMSDHEVNLKILLNRLVRDGGLTRDERNACLRDMTEDVARLVLASNDAHGRQLSRDLLRSRENIFEFARTIDFVTDRLGRTREELRLPSHEELQRRALVGEGLTRPELAVLSSWVKIYVYNAMLEGDPKAIPGYDEMLFGYFPKAVQERWPDEIRGHMLADEIAMTVATNRIVADAGAAFFPLMLEVTGRTVPEIATAFLKAQQLASTDAVRTTLEELRTSVSLGSLYRCWVNVDAGVREVAMFWLSPRGSVPTDAQLAEMDPAVDRVYKLQASEVLATNHGLLDELRAHDIPEDVAMRVLKAQYLNTTLMVWAEAKRLETTLEHMGVRHLAVARASRLQSVMESLSNRPASGRWEPIALQILNARLTQLLRNLVARTPVPEGVRTVDDLEPLLAAGPLAEIRREIDSFVDGETVPEISTLLVLEERLAGVIARMPGAA